MAQFDEKLPTKDILIVEDDQDLAELIERILLKLNLSVSRTTSFDEAIKMLSSFRYSLILTDINLGKSSGLDVLQYTKQHHPMLRVVLMTGYLEDTDIHDALDLGVFGFLAKPISKKEIKKVVKNALGESSDKITDLEYARVDIDDFLTGKILNFPVYIRLKDSRFLKIAHSGTEIDIERINQLRDKGISELWIDKEDLPAYLALNEKILNAKTKWTPAGRVKFLNHLAEISYESMRLLNISNESVRYCLDSLNILTKEISNIEGTLPLINPFLTGEARSSKMAVNGVTLTLLVASVLDWNSEKMMKSLSLGAFFRDISLTQEGFQYNLLFTKGANYDKSGYREHPNRSVEILENLGGFPKEALTIIQQHHEDGTPQGFPNGIPRSQIYAPALLVNAIDKLIFFMHENQDMDPKNIQSTVLRFIENNFKNKADEKITALSLFIKHGDVQRAKKEFERLKKL